MINSCPDCNQKDDLINKYLKLIKLLKAKCDKTAKSFAKNNTLPSDTLFQSSYENSKSQQLSNPHKSELNPQKIIPSSIKCPELRLAAIIISNKSTKALLNHALNKIKLSIKPQMQPVSMSIQPSLNLQGSLSAIIQQTINSGKNMQQKNNFQNQFQKQLLSKIFHFQLQNQSYLKQIQSLQKKIQDSQKRFLKQTQKKRQSLQTVAEQIRQKTELVVQMQHLIKRYERALGRSLDNISVQSVLVQDTEELKRTCLRLQNINEKLNDDVRNIQLNFDELNKKLLNLNEENQTLKSQTKNLEQKNFELEKSLNYHINLEKSYKTILKRLDKKILAIQRKQKQLYSSMKLNSQLFNSFNMVSTKNTELSLGENTLQKRQSLGQFQIQQKIQEIFTFLFNIKSQSYDLNNLHLFDEQELELLKSHKNIYLKHVKQDSFIEVKRQKISTKKQLDDSNFDEGDSIFYKKPQNVQEHSFFCALDQKKTNDLQLPATASPISNIKLIQMEIEKSKLIQKISELKNHQMHIRNVILNLLKVLDLSNPRPQSEGIMQIIFDFFEYSQDEKASIFRQKKKKFWGIL